MARIDGSSLRSFSFLTMACFAFASAPASAATNIVVNGDFETGDLTGWTQNPSNQWDVISQSGGNHEAVGIADLGGQGHLYQNLALTKGQTYSLFLHYAGGRGDEYAAGTISLSDQILGQIFSGGAGGHNFQSDFVAGSSSKLDFNVYSPGQALSLDNISVTALNGAPATVAQLARASADAYNTKASNIGNFSPLSRPYISPDGLKIQAYANPDKSRIIFSVRGTLQTDLKNLVIDASIGTGINNPTSVLYLTEAASYLKTIAQTYTGAKIQITGHSLGGTIAQVLGVASGLGSTSYDAPGGAALYYSNAGLLASLGELGTGSTTVNYREYGDQYSLFGDQLGAVVTVGDKDTSCCLPSSIIDLKDINLAHAPLLIASSLLDPKIPETDGISGPNIVQLDTLLPQTVIPTLGIISFGVSAGLIYNIDPSGADAFTFMGQANSPYVSSIILPSLEGINSYQFSYFSDGKWSQMSNLNPLSKYELGGNVSGFRFSALDDNGKLFRIDDPIFFGVEFASSGQFNGTLQGSTQAVPEPKSWLMLMTGFLLVGLCIRCTRVADTLNNSRLLHYN